MHTHMHDMHTCMHIKKLPSQGRMGRIIFKHVYFISSSSEAIESAALALQCVYNVQCCDGLAACVIGVCDSVAYYVLKEHLEHPARLFVDHTGNAFDSAATSHAADSRFSDALDAVAQDLAMTHCAALAEPHAALAEPPAALAAS